MQVKRISIVFLFSIMYLCSLSIISAKPINNEIATLNLVTMDLPPYGWIDKEGKPQGIIYELTEEIGKRSGLPYTHKIRPFSRMLLELKVGNVDLLSSQAHKRSLDAGDKLAIQFYIDVIAGTNKDSNIKTIKDFKDKNLIYHHGAFYKQLDGLPKKITYVKKYRQALIMLHKRKSFHGAVFSEPAYYYWMKDLNLSNENFGKVLMVEENKEQWLFVRKDLPLETRKMLKKIVQDMYNEGFYESLLKKYGKH